MRASPLILLLCAAACGCQDKQQSAKLTPETAGAASALNAFSAEKCPFPATAGQYEDTTLTARHKYGVPPDASVFSALHQGCAVLSFTVRDQGIVSGSTVLSEYPPGFGAVAAKILRWNDYAEGAYSDTAFIVRIGGESLPQGGAMTSLTFKSSALDLVVPP
jgi:hypothetical protein